MLVSGLLSLGKFTLTRVFGKFTLTRVFASFRFSGGTSGLSIGHCSPEAAGGGTIGLVRDGDRILIDIPQRGINLLVDDAELTRRRTEQEAKGWKPAQARPRKVSTALKAYALLATSADKGAVRDKALLDG